MSALRTEIVGGRAFATLAPDWERLYAEARNEPSTSFEWTQALFEFHLGPADEAFAVVVRDEGGVVAIAPVLLRRERLAGVVGLATLSPLSELYRTHSDILGACDRADVIAAVFAALDGLPRRWDLYRVGRLRQQGRFAQGLSGFLAAGGRRSARRREFPSYLIRLDGGFERYLAARSAKFRNYLRRKTRQLESMGRIEARRAGSGLSIDDAYRDLIAVERQSWKHAHGTSIAAVPRQLSFYRRLCEESARRGNLHLTLMYLDGRPIAFNLGLVHGPCYYYLKTSYDQALKQAGAATVFRARLVERLMAEGVALLDFPGAPYQWEEQWADEVQWHDSVVVFGRGWRATLCRFLIALRGRFRPRRDDDAIRHADPRALRGE